MPEEAEREREEPLAEPARHRDLSTVERFVAGMTGALLIIAGFWVLFFAKNDGQWAVAVGFVGGAVLLIMAVQGTPLIKLGARDVSMGFAGRLIREKAEEVAAAEGAKAAGDFIHGVVTAVPEARLDPVVINLKHEIDRQAQFENDLSSAVELLNVDPQTPRVEQLAIYVRGEISGSMQIRYGELRILIVAPYAIADGLVLDAPQFRQVQVRFEASNADGLLVVTNGDVSPYVRRRAANAAFPFVPVTNWRAERWRVARQSVDEIRAGLDQLAEQIRSRDSINKPPPSASGPP